MSDVADPEPSDNSPAEVEEDDVARYTKLLKRKKTEFLEHLLRNMDILTYVHFSYMYFLDCSLLRFVIRAAVQLNFLTPKPAGFPAIPQRRSVLIAIAVSVAFCILSHLFSAAPSAGERTNGYLHGGLIIDFIGQEGPISKLRLVAVDLFITFLQLSQLTLVIAKQDLAAGKARAEEIPTQDIHAEERGERRRYSYTSSESSSPTDNEDARERRRRHQERHRLLDNGDNEQLPGSSPRERGWERRAFEISSGEFMVAKIDIPRIVRRQWREGNRSRGESRSGSTIGMSSSP